MVAGVPLKTRRPGRFDDPYRGSAGFGLSDGGRWSVGRRIAVGGSVGARIRAPSDRLGLRSEVPEHRFWRPWATGVGFRLGLQRWASGLGFSLGLALQPWASDRRDQRDRADGGSEVDQRSVGGRKSVGRSDLSSDPSSQRPPGAQLSAPSDRLEL